MKPFEDPILFKMEVFNELMILLMVYSMMCLSDANTGLAGHMLVFDMMFLSCVIMSLSVAIGFLLKEAIISNKNKIKKKCCKPKANPPSEPKHPQSIK